MVWKNLAKEACVMVIAFPVIISAGTAGMMMTMKYVDKYVFEDKKK